MSYPSIKNVDPNTLTEQEREKALFAAFHADLPLGMAAIELDVTEVKSNGNRKLVPEDPNSPLGKQIIRLLGTDVARGILERHHGVAFGLYNCCGRVVAPEPRRSADDHIGANSAPEWRPRFRRLLSGGILYFWAAIVSRPFFHT